MANCTELDSYIERWVLRCIGRIVDMMLLLAASNPQKLLRRANARNYGWGGGIGTYCNGSAGLRDTSTSHIACCACGAGDFEGAQGYDNPAFEPKDAMDPIQEFYDGEPCGFCGKKMTMQGYDNPAFEPDDTVQVFLHVQGR